MKWKSKYSFEILKNICEALEFMSIDVRNNLCSIKVIVQSLLNYLDEIEGSSVSKTELIMQTRNIITKCFDNDFSGELYAISFSYELAK